MTTRLQPTSKFLTVNGLRLRILEWGQPGALPVVCVHGYTGSAEAFNAPARHLQDRAHIVAMDVRGHGESAWSPDGAYQYRDQAGDLAALVDRLELDRFVLIGTSMGGIIAMAYAAQSPERLRGLVINDIGPEVEAGSQRITGLVGSRPNDFGSLDEAMEYRRQISPITAGRPIEDQRETALGVLRQQPDGRWVWKMDPAYIEQRIARGAPARPALWPALQALPCPTLVVWGHRQRRLVRSAGQADDDGIAEGRTGRRAWRRPRADPRRTPRSDSQPSIVCSRLSKSLRQDLRHW